MILLRKVFFYLFAVVYLILCPIVILYALGYIWAPRSDQQIVKTGLIYLKTLPRDATTHIRNRVVAQKTPVMLNDLRTGEYDLHVSRKNYRPLKMKVNVEAGRAKVLDRVLLIPQTFQVARLLEDSIGNWIVVSGTPYFLLFTGKDLKSVAVYDWKGKEARKLFLPGEAYADAVVLETRICQGSSFVVFRVQKGTEEKVLGVSLAKKDSKLTDLTPYLAAEALANSFWEADKSSYLFMNQKPHLFQLRNTTLSMLNLKGMVFQPNWLAGIQGAGLYEDFVYALELAAVYRVDYSKRIPVKELVDKIEFLRTLFLPDCTYRIEFLSDKLALFISDRGQLLTNRLPYLLIEHGVRGYDFFAKKEWLLLWTQNALGTINFSEAARDREKFFERGEKIDWVYSRGRNIEKAFWVYEGSHLLFLDQGWVYLQDLAQKGSAEPEKIIQVKPESGIFYDEDSGRLFYLGAADSQLSSIPILPEEHSLLELAQSKETPDTVFLATK